MDFSYVNEIITVASIALLMVVSPGQDFAMITRNSILYSRRAGLIGAFGIFLAIWLHVSYSLAGIALLISQSPIFYSMIKYLGAGYLLFLGIKSLTFKKSDDKDTSKSNENNDMSAFQAFKCGFISNALNPKTTLFFLSIFTQVVDEKTPTSMQVLYGGIIAVFHWVWFSIVAYFFSSEMIVTRIEGIKVWFERFMGVCLCLLSSKIIFS
jgi:threonine/homoserine/homoserine lactone efflux protein